MEEVSFYRTKFYDITRIQDLCDPIYEISKIGKPHIVSLRFAVMLTDEYKWKLEPRTIDYSTLSKITWQNEQDYRLLKPEELEQMLYDPNKVTLENILGKTYARPADLENIESRPLIRLYEIIDLLEKPWRPDDLKEYIRGKAREATGREYRTRVSVRRAKEALKQILATPYFAKLDPIERIALGEFVHAELKTLSRKLHKNTYKHNHSQLVKCIRNIALLNGLNQFDWNSI
ncbi:hypothetical protein D6825_03135 [Candidatus Woesearchaeota archaeon]|nr:MAG: hypothetical protein D6825_03135 [Candidatus Woesearchaeota archaeon]